MAVYYFYLARCKDNTLYAGYCANIKDREAKHNKGEGAKYTKARRPIQIVYFEEFSTRSEAMKREAEIKSWSKAEKENLIT